MNGRANAELEPRNSLTSEQPGTGSCTARGLSVDPLSISSQYSSSIQLSQLQIIIQSSRPIDHAKHSLSATNRAWLAENLRKPRYDHVGGRSISFNVSTTAFSTANIRFGPCPMDWKAGGRSMDRNICFLKRLAAWHIN